MPRGVKKENLPSKVCVACGRPFNWRKKWERVWDEVTTCSKSCNRRRKGSRNGESKQGVDSDGGGAVMLTDGDGGHVMLVTGDGELDLLGAALGSVRVDDSTGDGAEVKARADGDDDEDQSQTSVASSASNDNGAADQQQSAQPTEMVPPLAMDAKARRKAEKKRKKAERRAQREGRGDPTAGQKRCTLCGKSVDLLVRCTYDESGEWVRVVWMASFMLRGDCFFVICSRPRTNTHSLATRAWSAASAGTTRAAAWWTATTPIRTTGTAGCGRTVGRSKSDTGGLRRRSLLAYSCVDEEARPAAGE